MPPTPDDLWLVQQELLEAAVWSLDLIPNMEATQDLLGAPDEQYVAISTPTQDCCDQVAVHIPTLGENLGVGERATSGKAIGRINMPTIMVTVTRCVPVAGKVGSTVRVPSKAEISASARQITADGWAIWNGIYSQLAQGCLWASCDQVFWEGMTKIHPSGGCAGWRLTLRRSLDGYVVDCGS